MYPYAILRCCIYVSSSVITTCNMDRQPFLTVGHRIIARVRPGKYILTVFNSDYQVKPFLGHITTIIEFDAIVVTEIKIRAGREPIFDPKIPGYEHYQTPMEGGIKGGALLYLRVILIAKEEKIYKLK